MTPYEELRSPDFGFDPFQESYVGHGGVLPQNHQRLS